jgi:hypothetical protein
LIATIQSYIFGNPETVEMWKDCLKSVLVFMRDFSDFKIKKEIPVFIYFLPPPASKHS